MTFTKGARERVALTAARDAVRSPWPFLLAVAPAVGVWVVGGSFVEGLAALILTVIVAYVIYPLVVLARSYWWTAERQLQETRGPAIERFGQFLDRIGHLRGLPHHPSNLTSSFGIEQSYFGSALKSFHWDLGEWLTDQGELTSDEAVDWHDEAAAPGFTDLVSAEVYLTEKERLLRDSIDKLYST